MSWAWVIEFLQSAAIGFITGTLLLILFGALR